MRVYEAIDWPGQGSQTRRSLGGAETHGVSRSEPGRGRGPRVQSRGAERARRLGAGQGDLDTQPWATEGRSLLLG